MSLHKICKSIDLSSQNWLDYCQWRQFDFTSFESIDSSINESRTDTDDIDYWDYCVSNGNYLTDIVNDLDYAKRYATRIKADVILSFDFLDSVDPSQDIIGYDILDGAFDYSLLTNFGNDISIVNRNLEINGLIKDKEKTLEIHRWFLENMTEDEHVIGSQSCAVYNKITQPF